MSELKRKKNESFEGFMRRVKQQWQRSGKLLEARKKQYFVPKKSDNVKRTQAVTYAKKQAKTEYLRKTGKLPQEELNKLNKRTSKR